MIRVTRSDFETLLFWIGATAPLVIGPLITNRSDGKYHSPLQAAMAGAVIGGFLFLIPALGFAYGQSRHQANGQLKRRHRSPLVAFLLGCLIPGLGFFMPGEVLMIMGTGTVLSFLVSRLAWKRLA